MRSAKSKQGINDIRTPARSKQNLIEKTDPADSDSACMEIISPTMVLLTPPATALKYSNENAMTMNYTFKEVFPPEINQQGVFDKVAFPLLEGLIKGKNGLLFTYGVTGSGKTFTMIGEPQNCGILPRCLNIIFKTIKEFQAHKYIIKPDKMNMFDIQTEADAMLERQLELHKFKSGINKHSNPYLAMSSSDVTKIGGINQDNQYAVFVTYLEIHNNSVFDLLEDPISRNLPVKFIREDAAHNTYVHGVTEVEIKSAKEAFDAFYLGLKRKRMASTSLNAELSRSHSVFTLSVGLTSGRRKANRLFTTARDNMGRPEAKDLEMDLGLVYSLGPDFPSLELNSSQAALNTKELTECLEMRISGRETLERSLDITEESFRSALLELEKDTLAISNKNAALREQLAASERNVRDLEECLAAIEKASLIYQNKMNELTEYTAALKRDLLGKDIIDEQDTNEEY